MGLFWTFFPPYSVHIEDTKSVEFPCNLFNLFFIKWLDYSSRTPYLYASLILHTQLVKKWCKSCSNGQRNPGLNQDFLSLFMRFTSNHPLQNMYNYLHKICLQRIKNSQFIYENRVEVNCKLVWYLHLIVLFMQDIHTECFICLWPSQWLLNHTNIASFVLKFHK